MAIVEIKLSDQLAQEAKRAGLLTAAAIERLLREALRAERLERMIQDRVRLAEHPLPPMSPEEVQAEIDAYRAEQRRATGT